jgi:hypothetical protein
MTRGAIGLGALLLTVCTAAAQPTAGTNGETHRGSSKSAEQRIGIMSTVGATCRVVREGDAARIMKITAEHAHTVLHNSGPGEYVEGQMQPTDPDYESALEEFKIDLDKNHNDLRVTCSLAGYRTKSVAAAAVQRTWIIDFAPCAVFPNDATEAERTAIIEACKDKPRSATNTRMQYPDTIRVILMPD